MKSRKPTETASVIMSSQRYCEVCWCMRSFDGQPGAIRGLVYLWTSSIYERKSRWSFMHTTNQDMHNLASISWMKFVPLKRKLNSVRYVWVQYISIAACAEHIRSRCHRDEEIRPQHSSALTATLASHPTEDRIQSANGRFQDSRNGSANLLETRRPIQGNSTKSARRAFFLVAPTI